MLLSFFVARFSTVISCLPCIIGKRRRHELTALYEMSFSLFNSPRTIVQAPQSPCPQPSLTPFFVGSDRIYSRTLVVGLRFFSLEKSIVTILSSSTKEIFD